MRTPSSICICGLLAVAGPMLQAGCVEEPVAGAPGDVSAVADGSASTGDIAALEDGDGAAAADVVTDAGQPADSGEPADTGTIDAGAEDVATDVGKAEDSGQSPDTGSQDTGADDASDASKDTKGGCGQASDCAGDAGLCKKWACKAGACAAIDDDGKACDDDNVCTPTAVCKGAACLPDTATSCDDANVCTNDSCDKKAGCKHSAEAGACSDGSACTGPGGKDACNSGVCAAGAEVICDDQNPCTADSCDEAKGCVHIANTATCDDGNVCTIDDACKGSACLPGATTSCDDNNPCTTDGCDKLKGCLNAANTANCDDNSKCTTVDVCKDKACAGSKPPSCDDKNPCTTDSCDTAKGCVNAANTAKCDDGDVCTLDDACKGSVCLPGAATSCDDNNPCTTDGCDKLKGCLNAANTANCDDNSKCTTVDVCKDKACAGSKPPSCDDKNPCTTDSCDTAKGCVNAANTAKCDDSNKCTTVDVCKDKACAGTKPPSCGDGNVCTVDSCDTSKGCLNEPTAGSCSDGSVCTDKDECEAGKCVAGAEKVCDDKNPCTTDSCDAKAGCETATVKDGTGCGTGKLCKAGKCEAQTSVGCPANMLRVGGAEPFCIDIAGNTPMGKDAAKTLCPARGDGGRICTVDEIDNAIAGIGYKPPAGNFPTAASEKCCCPCGPPSTLATHWFSPTGGAHGFKRGYCECWSKPQTFLCCSDAGADDAEGQIVYLHDKKLWLIRPDGSGAKVLTDGGEGPRFSPDGKWVVFDKNPGIWKIGSDGQGLVKLTDYNHAYAPPYWSHDGKYVYYCGTNVQVWRVGADGKGATKWFQSPGGNGCAGGVASPDGKYLFHRLHTSNWEAWRFNADGSGAKKIRGAESGISDVLPDSSKILLEIKGWDIFLADLDGGNQVKLIGDSADDYGGRWSPDGKRLVFYSTRDGGGALWIADADGKNAKKLTAGVGPDWGVLPNAEVVDFDHDGLAGAADKCPTVWSPDNAEVCPEWSGQGWSKSQDVGLGQPDGKGGVGASAWRRTNEPVEVPLVNGILDSSVVGYWKLDGDVLDSSGNGLVGSEYSGAFASGSAFTGGDALRVDTKNPGMRIKHGGQLDFGPADAFSMSIWFRTKAAASSLLIGTAFSGANNNLAFLSIHSGKVRGLVRGIKNGGNGPSVELVEPVNDGNWHLASFVHDGANKMLSLYMDGVLRGTTAVGESSTYGGQDWLVGGRYATEAALPDLDLDDALVWRRALTSAEIATYYYSKAPYSSTFAPGAQADFDDVRITESTDGGKTHHGTHFEVVGARPHSDTDLEGVVAYWKLDGDAKDSGAGAMDGTLVGVKPTQGRFGVQGRALDFSGAGFVKTSYVPVLGASEGATLEAWVRIDPSVADKTCLLAGAASYGSTAFYLTWGPGLRFQVGEVKAGIAVSTGGYADGNWHHVAGVRDAAAKRLRLYVDGVQVAVANDTSPGFANPNKFTFLLGGFNPNKNGPVGNSADYKLKGQLDEVIVHKVAKSADYIAKRARGLPRVRFLAHTAPTANTGGAFDFHKYELRWGNAAAKTVPTALVGLDKTSKCGAILSPCLGYAGWWRFDESGGKVAFDVSTPRRNGTMAGLGWVQGVSSVAATMAAGQVVTLPAQVLKISADHTIELQARIDSLAKNIHSFQKMSDGVGWLWQSDSAGIDKVLAGTKGGTNFGYKLVAGAWSQIALAVNWGAGTGSLWQNAKLVIDAMKLDASAKVDNSEAVLAGGFPGAIEGLRLMERALTADELLHYPLAAWSMKAELPPAFDLSNVVGRIAFNVDGKELWTARADGSDAKKVVTGAVGQVDFSMDGRSLLYVSDHTIRTVSVDGTGDKLFSKATWFNTLAVSRAGRIIATQGNDQPSPALWTIEADGTGAKQVITGPQNTTAPTWSPDGKRIAWTTNKSGCDRTIRVANADGSGAFNIAAVHLGDGYQGSWSPNGKWLAFQNIKYGSCNPAYPTESKIYIVEPKAAAVPIQVTKGPGNHSNPDWLDDDYMYFTSDADGDRDVYLTNITGTQTRRITNLPGDENGLRFYGVRLPEKMVRHGKVLGRGGPGGISGAVINVRPVSVHRGTDDVLRMWFGENAGCCVRAFMLATSSDGLAWTKYDKNPVLGGQRGPVAVDPVGSGYRAWMSTGGWTHYATLTSGDGVQWADEAKFADLEPGYAMIARRLGDFHGWRSQGTSDGPAWDHVSSADGKVFGDAKMTNLGGLGVKGPGDARWVVDRFVAIGGAAEGLVWLLSDDGVVWTRGPVALAPGVQGAWDAALSESDVIFVLERRSVALLYGNKTATDIGLALTPAAACEAAGGYWAPTQLPAPDDQGCWFKGGHMQSCTDACKAKGRTCDAGAWNADAKCALNKHWSSCNYGCAEGTDNAAQDTSLPGVSDHPISSQKYCFYGRTGVAQQCDAANPYGDGTWPGRFRLCVCR